MSKSTDIRITATALHFVPVPGRLPLKCRANSVMARAGADGASAQGPRQRDRRETRPLRPGRSPVGQGSRNALSGVIDEGASGVLAEVVAKFAIDAMALATAFQ